MILSSVDELIQVYIFRIPDIRGKLAKNVNVDLNKKGISQEVVLFTGVVYSLLSDS